MTFKDHFSRQSEAYRRYRPGYPAPMVAWIAAQAPDHRLAVDCATGNGQAAAALARHFDRVIAVDGSRSQLGNAEPCAGVHYVAALAERLPVKGGAVSLVAAAQAAHWFDFDRFHAECRRVLVPGGIVAAWTYETFRIDPAIDGIVDRFYSGVVGEYWPPERRYVEQGYRTLPFPWREIAAPAFELEGRWDLDDVMNYLTTWSSVQRYKDARGADPLPALRVQLAEAWPDRGQRPVRWPIHLRIGHA